MARRVLYSFKSQEKYAFVNKYVFNFASNVSKVCSWCRISSGSEFQSFGPETQKLRGSISTVRGITRSPRVADLWAWRARLTATCDSDSIKYISDTAGNRTHNLFRHKCSPIPLGHSDGQFSSIPGLVWDVGYQLSQTTTSTNTWVSSVSQCNAILMYWILLRTMVPVAWVQVLTVYQYSMKCINILWSVSIFYEVYQYSMKCINILWSVSIFYKVYQYSMKCINILWSVSIFYEVYLYSMKCINILWSVSIFYEVYQYSMKCINIL